MKRGIAVGLLLLLGLLLWWFWPQSPGAPSSAPEASSSGSAAPPRKEEASPPPAPGQVGGMGGEPEILVVPPRPASAEAVAAVLRENPTALQACFRVVDPEKMPDRVEIFGEIGSLSQLGDQPRGYVRDVEVELPDGNLASPSAVHCFTAAASAPSGYDTPRTGPVEFALIAHPNGRVELSPAGD